VGQRIRSTFRRYINLQENSVRLLLFSIINSSSRSNSGIQHPEHLQPIFKENPIIVQNGELLISFHSSFSLPTFLTILSSSHASIALAPPLATLKSSTSLPHSIFGSFPTPIASTPATMSSKSPIKPYHAPTPQPTVVTPSTSPRDRVDHKTYYEMTSTAPLGPATGLLAGTAVGFWDPSQNVEESVAFINAGGANSHADPVHQATLRRRREFEQKVYEQAMMANKTLPGIKPCEQEELFLQTCLAAKKVMIECLSFRDALERCKHVSLGEETSGPRRVGKARPVPDEPRKVNREDLNRYVKLG